MFREDFGVGAVMGHGGVDDRALAAVRWGKLFVDKRIEGDAQRVLVIEELLRRRE